MNRNRISNWSRAGMLACGLFAATAIGCQTDVGGQTLPSGYYLRDDVQYFPAGPEFKLTNQVRALKQYELQQRGVGLPDEEPPQPPAPGP